VNFRSQGFIVYTAAILITGGTPLSAGPWHPELTHRPRLLFTADQLETIRGRLAMDPFHSLWYNTWGSYSSLYTRGRQMVDSTANTLENPRTFTEPRAAIAKAAAFVYALNKRADGTSDLDDSTDTLNPWPREQYREHALAYLRTLDPTVHGPSSLFDFIALAPYVNNWQHRSEELLYYCQAYDLLLGAGAEPDSVVEARLAEFADNLLTRYTAFSYVSRYLLRRNNHKLILAAALGTAAITLNHHERAEDWINTALILIEWVLFADPEDGPDGVRQIDSESGYGEGPAYLRYAWRKLLPFFIALKNFNGDWTETYSNAGIPGYFPDDPNLNTVAIRSPWYDPRYAAIYDWITRIRQPEGRVPSLEDCQLNVYFPELALAGAAYAWPLLPDDTDSTVEQLLNRHLGPLRADYICAGNAPGTGPPESWGTVQYLPEAGSVVFRSDWSTTAVYLHLNGRHGSPRLAAAAHDQADVTHFTLGYRGKLLAMDAGYPGWDNRYLTNKPEHHNLILVDGYGPAPPSGPTLGLAGTQLIFSAGDPSPVDGYFQNLYEDETFAYVELTSHYGRTYSRYPEAETIPGQEVWLLDENDSTDVAFRRVVLFVERRYFLLLDEVDNPQEPTHTYTWLLHGNGGGDTGGEFQALPGGGIISRGEANLLSYTTAPGGLDSLVVGLSQHAVGHGVENLADHTLLQALKTAVDTRFLSVLFPFDTSPPEIIPVTTGEQLALVVDRTPVGDDRFELVLTQPPGDTFSLPAQTVGELSLPAVETAATFLVVSLNATDPDPATARVFGQGAGTASIGGIIFELPQLHLTEPKPLPERFALHAPYPNPFNTTVTVPFSLPVRTSVKLAVYNLLGVEINVLLDTTLGPGRYAVRWNGSRQPSGIYFVTLSYNGHRTVRKVLLLK
jgi:hypothetical protein